MQFWTDWTTWQCYGNGIWWKLTQASLFCIYLFILGHKTIRTKVEMDQLYLQGDAHPIIQCDILLPAGGAMSRIEFDM